MSQITDIKPKSKKSRRYSIFVDDELAAEGNGGVDREIAEAVISEELADYDEHSRAEQAAAKHIRKLANLEPATRRRRLYSYLQRRGFASYLIHDVLQEVQPDDD